MLRYIHQSEKTSNNADHEDCRLLFFFFFFFFVFSPNNSFVWTHIGILNTASKESEFGVFLVRMWENTNQTNSKHRHFSRSGKHSHNLTQQSWVLSVVILKKRHAQFKKIYICIKHCSYQTFCLLFRKIQKHSSQNLNHTSI